MIYSADEAVSAAPITLGVIGVVLAIPAFALFLYGDSDLHQHGHQQERDLLLDR